MEAPLLFLKSLHPGDLIKKYELKSIINPDIFIKVGLLLNN